MQVAGRRADITFIVTAAAVGMIIVVAWIVDASPMATGDGWQRRTGVIVVVALLWVLTLFGRLGLVWLTIGVGAGVSWLNYDRLTDARTGGPSLVIMLLAVWWTALVGTRLQTVVAVGLGLLTSLTYLFDGDIASITGMALVTFLGASAARSYAGQRRLLADLRQAQKRLGEQAAAAERARIAREVHDVAAHSLAITMLHLTGARMLARRLKVDVTVVDAIHRAEEAGRESMTELRAAVGLLRDSRPPAHHSPQLTVDPGSPAGPTAEEITRLVDQYAAAGLPVTLSVSGDLAHVPPVVGRTLYRTVQECLANVVRHAGQVTTTVQVDVGDDCLVTVCNALVRSPAPRHGGGLGLAGIRERVEALGGTVAAGPDPQGWQIQAHIPLLRPDHE